MTSDVLEKAAEPFFTTKPPGFGTGLGLSQVHGFISQSGGKLHIHSMPGEGTQVRLILPLASAGPKTWLTKDAEDACAQAGETVLVVDDDMAVRSFISEALKSLGYDVKEAPTPELAITILARGERCDAVLADIVMPGMDGWTLADEISRRYPDLPVGLMTGYYPSNIDHQSAQVVLRKPFTISELATALRRLIGVPVQEPGPVA
jgi:CheY-like chemotaxis protein